MIEHHGVETTPEIQTKQSKTKYHLLENIPFDLVPGNLYNIDVAHTKLNHFVLLE